MKARATGYAPWFLILVVWAVPAHAQNAGDKAAAEALFQEGKALLEAADYDKACPKLEASQALDPGIGTLLYLGECYAKVGKTASAWATFKEAASRARAESQTERQTVAQQRAAELEAKLSRLSINVAPEIRRIEGLEVRLNGTVVPEATWGTLVPVDPGTQTVEATAPGYEPWKTSIDIQTGPAESTVDVPALVALETPEPPQDDTAALVAPAPAPVGAEPPRSASAGRTVGYVLGGAGIVGLAVGSVFGLNAISKNNESQDNCRTQSLCTAYGLELRQDARDAATISTIGFVGGAILLGSGITFLVLSPDRESSPADQAKSVLLRAHLTPDAGRVVVQGTF